MASDMTVAMQHMQSGKYKAACKVLRQIVAREPSNVQAMHVMGVAYVRMGKLGQAERAISKAVRTNPTLAFGHNNLGEVYRNQNKLEQAEARFRKALELDPDYADAHYNLGMVLQASGRAEDAAACYEKALECAPDDMQTLMRLAGVLAELERLEQAGETVRKALALDPSQAGLHINLATILRRQGRIYDSIVAGQEAVRLAPDLGAAHCGLGVSLTLAGDLPSALESHDRALELEPENEQFNEKRAETLTFMGRAGETIGQLEEFAEKFPDHAGTQFALASAYGSEGRRDEAIAVLRKTVALAPDHVGALCELVNAGKGTASAADVDRMITLLDDPDCSPVEKAALGFSLGKVFEERGDYDRAFETISEANRRMRAKLSYSIDDDRAHFHKLRNALDVDYFADRPEGVSESDLPIFIIGMPRSGSTLVEQIMAGHPDVYAAGEVGALQMAALKESDDRGVALYPDRAGDLDAAALGRIATGYLDRLKAHSLKDAIRVTDKALYNFQHVGLIRSLFKHPRIVHVQRDPMDTCWSIYSTQFRAGQSYGYDLSELGAYYRLYQELMDHWRSLMPGEMLEIEYESLIENLEEHTRQILDYCGLPFDERCLAFDKAKRSVSTASVWQVRQPLYKTSVQRWRRFEKHLEPLCTALDA